MTKNLKRIVALMLAIATYGQPVGTLPVPTREGFDFIGWFDENGTRYTDETVYLVDGNITLNARGSLWIFPAATR